MRRFTFVAVILVALPLFATEPNPSQRQRELIEKLFAEMNLSDTTTKLMDAVFAQVEKQFLDEAAAKGNEPEDIEEAKELFAAFRAGASKIDFGELLHDAYVHIYAKYFTEQELADLTAFYATPTGHKAIEVMDELMREGMQAGVQHVQPKLEELMTRVIAEQEKKRPWRSTMKDMRTVAVAVEAWATDNEELYPVGDYSALKEQLEPTYLKKFPEKDMWDHAYAYVVSADRRSYRIVSAGSDSIFEWDSRRIVPTKEGQQQQIRYRDRLEEDLIFENGVFLQLPDQAKSQMK